MVDIARARPINDNVTFEVADMYSLVIDKKHDGIFGGFIWSHILLQDIDRFLDRVKDLIVIGGIFVFIDSNQVESTIHDKRRIAETDEAGNTYQVRNLEDGTAHRVLKNFPTKEFLVQKLSRIATGINYINLKHYWIVSCKLKIQ